MRSQNSQRFEAVGSKHNKTQRKVGIGSMLQCGESNKVYHLVKIGKIGELGKPGSLASLAPPVGEQPGVGRGEEREKGGKRER